MSPSTTVERAAAVFVPRAILGLMYLYAGGAKILQVGVVAYAQQSPAFSAMSAVLPNGLLFPVAVVLPFVEVALGVLILLGLFTRPVLRALSVILIVVGLSYGVLGLLHPIGATAMDITVVNSYILPRVALLAVVLFMPASDDLFTVDAVASGEWRRLLAIGDQ